MSFSDPEFAAGLMMSTGVLAAVFWSSVFRNLALTAVAGLLCWVFFRFGGTSGVVMFFKVLKDEFIRRPMFAHGAVLGVIVIVALVLALRQRQIS